MPYLELCLDSNVQYRQHLGLQTLDKVLDKIGNADFKPDWFQVMASYLSLQKVASSLCGSTFPYVEYDSSTVEPPFVRSKLVDTCDVITTVSGMYIMYNANGYVIYMRLFPWARKIFVLVL